MNERIIKVKGMECEGCENRIKNALNEINGIEKVEANHKTGIVKVLANENVTNKEIEDAIDDIGFESVKED